MARLDPGVSSSTTDPSTRVAEPRASTTKERPTPGSDSLSAGKWLLGVAVVTENVLLPCRNTGANARKAAVAGVNADQAATTPRCSPLRRTSSPPHCRLFCSTPSVSQGMQPPKSSHSRPISTASSQAATLSAVSTPAACDAAGSSDVPTEIVCSVAPQRSSSCAATGLSSCSIHSSVP